MNNVDITCTFLPVKIDVNWYAKIPEEPTDLYCDSYRLKQKVPAKFGERGSDMADWLRSDVMFH